MKDHLRDIIARETNPLLARNLIREYAQARILQALQETGAFTTWIFHGGTALRLLHRLPRFSEDLDFSLAEPSPSGDFAKVVASVRKAFEAEAYAVAVRRLKETPPVKSAFLSLPGLFHELGLSPHHTEALSVKIELDCRPPGGGSTETSIVRRFVILNILHYDKASMIAGKLHALLMRPYTKGRDLYDLFWYISDPSWPDPNFRFLNEALRQTGWTGPEVTATNWKAELIKKIEKIAWRKAIDDVRPFIEREADLGQLTRENVLRLLESRPSLP